MAHTHFSDLQSVLSVLYLPFLLTLCQAVNRYLAWLETQRLDCWMDSVMQG